jgi:hypothetical protein
MRGKLKHGILGLAALAVLATASSAEAADSKKVFAVRGIGLETCKAFVASMKDVQAQAVAAGWIMGYLTAANRVNPDTFDLSPIGALNPTPLLRFLVGACAKQPDQGVERVFSEIVQFLAIARNHAGSPIVQTKSGKNAAEVRAETLIAMQTKLIELGVFKGKADGVYGPKLEASLKAFQKDQKLPETGVADAGTVVRLLIELKKK